MTVTNQKVVLPLGEASGNRGGPSARKGDEAGLRHGRAPASHRAHADDREDGAATHWGLLSVPSGNFLNWYDSEAEARADLCRIVLREPEAVRTLAIAAFDGPGNPTGEAITASVTTCQGEVKAFTVPASSWSVSGEGGEEG